MAIFASVFQHCDVFIELIAIADTSGTAVDQHQHFCFDGGAVSRQIDIHPLGCIGTLGKIQKGLFFICSWALGRFFLAGNKIEGEKEYRKKYMHADKKSTLKVL